MSFISVERHLEAACALPNAVSWIGGEAVIGGGERFTHISPSTGRPQAELILAGPVEVDRAVRAARSALGGWRRMKPGRRGELLMRLADLIAEDKEHLAMLSSLENGMPSWQFSGPQLDIILGWMRYYAGFADKIEGVVTASWPSEHLEYTVPEPVGVVGAIIPWNAPMISLAMKVPAALAAGCTVVIKPAEYTPYTSARFVELSLKAGIPAGVINTVPGGAEAGAALVAHPGVDKISFTGGTVAAKRVMASCAETLKPALFELGGKSANIVFDDADIEALAPYCAAFPMGNSGQGCQLPTRLLVQEGVFDEVVARVLGTIEHLKVGDPLEPDTYMGPVVSAAAASRILNDIETGKRENPGALAAGGERLDEEGNWIKPTVFVGVDPTSRLAQQEIFGPVLSIFRFGDEAEAVALANSTQWGLAGYIQTRDLGRAHRVAAELVCGNVMINGAPNVHPSAPFGGVGLSGFGKEGGRWGIEEFIRHKSVGLRF